ncbi:MAG: flagellar basal body P-ring protein FlgI [Planctomycetaceae bacterium]|nr:flagellar basal body P-ring protein FlgI [Planctomycetaceae bacterium]
MAGISVKSSRRANDGTSPTLSRAHTASVWALLLALIVCSAAGCGTALLNMPSEVVTGMTDRLPLLNRNRDREDDDDDDDKFDTEITTPLLSEYISVGGNNYIALRGVGLVTGLNGMGGDPSPSVHRTELLQEMQLLKIPNPNKILASPDTALVLVIAYLPAMVREGDRFDVRVVLPPNSNAKSLRGGWLMETRLFEEATVPGRGTLHGHEFGKASGAILTGLGVNDDPSRRNAELMQGSIPGGAISKTDRDLTILLRRSMRDSRNTTRIADAVSARFNGYDRYNQRRIKFAEAKSDVQINLKVHPSYRNNFQRYQAVIRSIAFNESDVARRMRMEKLAEDLFVPEKAMISALRLEAIGQDAVGFLTDALESPDLEVRFHAAQALAYLNDGAGVPVLVDCAENEPALRVYALAALSVVEDPRAQLALRELFNAPELETRYGAFVALKELDPRDRLLNEQEFESGYQVYSIETTGEPMVHVRRYRAPEIVVFGPQQPLRLPAVLNAGQRIRVVGRVGERTVQVTRYDLGEEPVRKTVPNSLGQILECLGDLGATYPEVVQMMIEAEQQDNFIGDFGIERMPKAGRVYVSRDQREEMKNRVREAEGRQMGSPNQAPNLFESPVDHEEDDAERISSFDRLDLTSMDSSHQDPEHKDVIGSERTAEDWNDVIPDSKRAMGFRSTATSEDPVMLPEESSDRNERPEFKGLSEPAVGSDSEAENLDEFSGSGRDAAAGMEDDSQNAPKQSGIGTFPRRIRNTFRNPFRSSGTESQE